MACTVRFVIKSRNKCGPEYWLYKRHSQFDSKTLKRKKGPQSCTNRVYEGPWSKSLEHPTGLSCPCIAESRFSQIIYSFSPCSPSIWVAMALVENRQRIPDLLYLKIISAINRQQLTKDCTAVPTVIPYTKKSYFFFVIWPRSIVGSSMNRLAKNCHLCFPT